MGRADDLRLMPAEALLEMHDHVDDMLRLVAQYANSGGALYWRLESLAVDIEMVPHYPQSQARPAQGGGGGG